MPLAYPGATRTKNSSNVTRLCGEINFQRFYCDSLQCLQSTATNVTKDGELYLSSRVASVLGCGSAQFPWLIQV